MLLKPVGFYSFHDILIYCMVQNEKRIKKHQGFPMFPNFMFRMRPILRKHKEYKGFLQCRFFEILQKVDFDKIHTPSEFPFALKVLLFNLFQAP